VNSVPTELNRREPPDATVARLPGYLRVLTALADSGQVRVSSDELAAACGVGSAQLRKDLSHLGSYGVRGVGYDVAQLSFEIGRALGGGRDWPIIIVGMGNLGRALTAYSGFSQRGFRVAGLVDDDPDLAGEVIDGVAVTALTELPTLVASVGPAFGIIATPAGPAQAVCDLLVAAGIRSILSFAPVHLTVPAGVDVRRVDLATELQLLAVHQIAASNLSQAPGRVDA